METDEIKSSRYRVSLRFHPDGYWIAEHPELQGCVADGETAEDALASLTTARELWIESRTASGLDVPPPVDEPQHSGRFVLRIPRSLHRDLAAEAEAEGVSLNSHVTAILAGRRQKTSTRACADSLRVA
jgi:antitoxin HicB